MNLKQLKYFLTIAELGSMSAASRALFIAQPALSLQIANLETELAVSLFARSVKGVTLTSAGEKLIDHARTITRQVETAKDHVSSDSFSPRGAVRLVIDGSKAYTLLAPLLQRCAAAYPNIQLSVTDAMSTHAAQSLIEGKVDMAVIPGAEDLIGVEVTPLYLEPLHLIGKKLSKKINKQQDQGANDECISFAQLQHFPLVAPSKGFNLRHHIDEAALQAQHPLDIKYQQDTGLSLRCLTHHGMAYAILPLDVMAAELRLGELESLKIIDPPIQRVHSLVQVSGQGPSHAMQAVALLVKILVDDLCTNGTLDGQCLAHKKALN
ncbi:MAG: LysR family transcriptional regulator [Gammaproteobacteria bacterium]|nr:LysR family transcriptional regulator [Gammaproteobacteria bacterium]